MKTLQMPEFYPVSTVADLAAFLDILAGSYAFDPAKATVKSVEADWSSYSFDRTQVAAIDNEIVIVPSSYLEQFNAHLRNEIESKKRDIITLAYICKQKLISARGGLPCSRCCGKGRNFPEVIWSVTLVFR